MFKKGILKKAALYSVKETSEEGILRRGFQDMEAVCAKPDELDLKKQEDPGSSVR